MLSNKILFLILTYQLITTIYLFTGQNTSRLLNVSLVTVPSSLTFISEHETDGWCLAAHHRQDGDMLIGTSNGIQLLNRDGNELSEYSTSEEFNRTGLGAAVSAVSDRYVVASHPDTKQLILYDFITKQTEAIHPDVYPFGLHFLPDGHLLGVGGDRLIKYKVENGKLNTVWTCDGVTDGYSVCTDSDSLIYVSGMSLKLLYIISPSGTLLKHLLSIASMASSHLINLTRSALAPLSRCSGV
ncbi:hypothetical protein EB796_015754 [Bugula neritina]|uniref:Uncharacterized protein n=1 Tax=Bugula neritina TaxID=10212 RepID=A0A7J7JHX9_BUGNE|nr:hypothetical protein EB796_015754 [Bugula neritina]